MKQAIKRWRDTSPRIMSAYAVEMTRKRTRESLGRLLHEPCFYCDGTGQLQALVEDGSAHPVAPAIHDLQAGAGRFGAPLGF